MAPRGEVYWAQLPAPVGRQPVLIIQNNVGNPYSPSTIVVTLSTSPPEKEYPFLVALEAHVLGEPSWVHCEVILTTPQTLVADRLGSLGQAEMNKVDIALERSIGLR